MLRVSFRSCLLLAEVCVCVCVSVSWWWWNQSNNNNYNNNNKEMRERERFSFHRGLWLCNCLGGTSEWPCRWMANKKRSLHDVLESAIRSVLFFFFASVFLSLLYCSSLSLSQFPLVSTLLLFHIIPHLPSLLPFFFFSSLLTTDRDSLEKSRVVDSNPHRLPSSSHDQTPTLLLLALF